jgi:hypothetical protein
MKKNLSMRAILINAVAVLCLAQSLPQPVARADAAITPPPPTRPPVEIKFREMRFGKPPLVELYFDVTLRNSRPEPRWFLLPSNLSPESASFAAKGGVDKLEVYAPRGKGRVRLGHFLGTGGFQTLLLPPGGEVRLRLLPISFWGELPDRLQLEVVTAKRLKIGGEDAATWFGVNPTCSVKADIAEHARSQTRSLRSHATPDNREVAALFEEDSRFPLQVSLDEKNKERSRTAKPDDPSELFATSSFVALPRSTRLF